MVNRSTGRALFDIVYTKMPYFIAVITADIFKSYLASKIAESVVKLLEEVKLYLENSNLAYKAVADKKRRVK